MYIHMYIFICILLQVVHMRWIYIDKHVQIKLPEPARIHECVYMNICVYEQMRVYEHTCAYVHMCPYVCMYIFVYMYIKCLYA